MHQQMSRVLNNKWTISAVVGVTSFTLGAVGGYFYGRKESVVRHESDGVEPVPVENQLAFDFDEDELATITYIRDRNPGDIITEYAHSEFSEFELDWDAEMSVEEDELEDADEIANIFAGTDEEWNYDAEIMRRGSDPYTLHIDEFVANELGYDQHTFTYYSGDDILADENDVPVYNYSGVVGDLDFGHGSKDPNLVYIRSDKDRTEWEIIRHTGSFESEVLGLEIESKYKSQELRHIRSPQRFRMD